MTGLTFRVKAEGYLKTFISISVFLYELKVLGRVYDEVMRVGECLIELT